MNNAVFCKTMENVKNRMDLHLTTDDKNAIKWFSKINFKNAKHVEGLHLIEMHKKAIKYDKPVYVGTSILDLSKVCMMDFHYDVINVNFENRYNLIAFLSSVVRCRSMRFFTFSIVLPKTA